MHIQAAAISRAEPIIHMLRELSLARGDTALDVRAPMRADRRNFCLAICRLGILSKLFPPFFRVVREFWYSPVRLG
jgi:hypothetical protein